MRRDLRAGPRQGSGSPHRSITSIEMGSCARPLVASWCKPGQVPDRVMDRPAIEFGHGGTRGAQLGVRQDDEPDLAKLFPDLGETLCHVPAGGGFLQLLPKAVAGAFEKPGHAPVSARRGRPFLWPAATRLSSVVGEEEPQGRLVLTHGEAGGAGSLCLVRSDGGPVDLASICQDIEHVLSESLGHSLLVAVDRCRQCNLPLQIVQNSVRSPAHARSRQMRGEIVPRHQEVLDSAAVDRVAETADASREVTGHEPRELRGDGKEFAGADFVFLSANLCHGFVPARGQQLLV